MNVAKRPGLRFVKRPGVAAFDFQIGDFTQDGNWNTKSIAAIVPKRAKLIAIKMIYTAPAAGRFFGLRTPGDTYAYNTYGVTSMVAAAQYETNITFPVTTAQTFEYYLPAAGSTLASIIIQGWWL